MTPHSSAPNEARVPPPLRPIHDWNDFWFRPQNLTALGLFRVLLGFIALSKLFLLLPFLKSYFSERGVLTLAQSQLSRPLPRICLFDYLPVNSAPVIFGALIVVAALFTFGLGTRLMTILLWIGMLSIDARNPWIINSGDRLLSLILFFGLFSPWGEAISLDRLRALFRGDAPSNAPIGPAWTLRLIQLQVCMMYFWSTLAKVRGHDWLAGEAVYWMMRNTERARWSLPFLSHSMIVANLLAYFTLLVEGLFPFAVWSRRTRPYILAGGLALHLGIEQMMTIQIFGPLVLSTYLLFYRGEEIAAAWESLRRRVWTAPPTPAFYDGTCGFCTQSVVVLREMDVFHRLDIHSARDPRVQAAIPDLDVARADREFLVKTPQGHWHGGFYAIRWMLWRLPAGWPLAPLLYLPGVPWLGVRLYRWVADHRYLFKAGSGTCALPQ